MQSLMILGRQPTLGLAELESLYGGDKLKPAGTKAVIVDVDPCLLAFDRLGGSLKFCKLLTSLDTTDWQEVEKFLEKVSPDHSQSMPAGKMHLGLSAIDYAIDLKQLHASALKLKKAIRTTGRGVHVIPNRELELNSAQVIHNRLTGPNGWELVIIKDSRQTLIAQTIKVQDIELYSQRDQRRPMRDAKIGMLPPKLAQIILNLAAGLLPADKLESICEIPEGQDLPRPDLGQTILDPFCGSGVVLQEALLMGYGIYGTDINKRMVDFAGKNIDWLNSKFKLGNFSAFFEVADATDYKWKHDFDFVASETYLGRPFTSLPSDGVLAQTMGDCNLIIGKFLKNIYAQLRPGTRLCLAIPAWQMKNGEFKYLPLIDQIEDFGYNEVSFEHGGHNLLYFRSNQIVARQLLVIIRK
jgi:tRNA G10  N-methylase Trm11